MLKNVLRNSEVLRLRKEGRTFAQIAEDLGITRQRAWQIANRDSRGRKKTIKVPVEVVEKLSQGALLISNAFEQWARK